MSGTNASQITSFTNAWAPYAVQAGNALNVSPQIIIDQWGAESGYGTNSGAANNNVAGIMVPGTTTQASYSSPASFVTAYVNTIANNFPSAENAGNSLSSFVAGLTNTSGQTYYGTGTNGPAYATLLSGTGQTINNTAPTTYAALASAYAPGSGVSSVPGTASTTTSPTTGATTTGACGGGTLGLNGFFTWTCWEGIAGDMALLGVGVVILLVAVASGVFGDSSRKALVRGTRSVLT